MRAMGLDVGSRTIGLALSDEARMLASAWETWRRQGQEADATEMLARAAQRGASHFVVGWPLELDGRIGTRARRVQAFVDVLREKMQGAGQVLAIDMWDERFSTAAAERTLIEADLSRKKRKTKIDAMAAQHILQGWLDAQANAEQEIRRNHNAVSGNKGTTSDVDEGTT